ncbi:MAG TPA: DUF6350 family protein, partial [Microbacterium sp.]|nr:DUF6350 family protein [Microbacterium sp.]
TTANPIARPTLWQAVLLPVALYGVSALCGAIAVAWRLGDDGVIDALRRRLDRLPHGWGEVPGLIARGTAIAVAALVAAASVTVAVAVLLRGGEVIALYESTHLDALGATVVTLGQLAYLPTLVVWALSWLAGPGFAIGVGTAVSPAGTQLGVLPGIPALGLIPEQGSEWLLLALLVPVAAGAVAGWAIRSRLVASRAVASVPAPRAELSGLVPTMPLAPPATSPEHEPIGPRLAVATGIGVSAGAFAALLAWAASGSLGPGRLSEVGPAPGPVALAVGLEVLVGAAILLLGPQAGPRQKEQKTGREERNRLESEQPDAAAGDGMAQRAPGGLGDGIAQPAPAVPLGSDETSAIVDPVATDKGAKTEKPAKPTTARKPDADPWALLSKSKAARTRDAGASSPATPDEKAPVD